MLLANGTRTLDQTIPNIRHLRAFSEVAARGSISEASERIFLSQPAISQALAKLEQRVGVELFERRSDGMHLTEAGAVFLDRVNRALALLRGGAREAARGGPAGERRRGAGLEQSMTTTQLRALIAVADAHSFTLAARNLGSSQPSVHRAARDLERALELPLLEKTSRGIEITRVAQPLVRQAKLAFAELEQGFAEVDALQGRDAGSVAIGTLPLARTHILPSAINAFSQLHAEVRIRVVDGPYDDLLQGLRHGDLDAMVGALRDPAPVDDIVQEPLFDDPLAIVARRGHPLASSTRITRRQLAAYPWVVPRGGAPTWVQFDELLGNDAGPRPRSIVESSSLVLIRGILLESDRLTILSARQARFEIDQGLLETLPFDTSRTTRAIGLTLRSGWRPTEVQARFLDMLREACDEPGTPEGSRPAFDDLRRG